MELEGKRAPVKYHSNAVRVNADQGFPLCPFASVLIHVSCLLSAVCSYGTQFDLWNSHHALCSVSNSK